MLSHGRSIINEDQRGHPRQVNGSTTIGAFELDLALHIISLRINGPKFELTFNSLQAKKHRLQSKSMITDPWQTVADNIPGTGDYVTTTGLLPTTSTAFFQIVSIP